MTKFNFWNNIIVLINNFKLNFFFIFFIFSLFLFIKYSFNLIYIFILICLKLNFYNNFILYNFYSGYYKIHPILLYIGLMLLVINVIKTKYFLFTNFISIFIIIFITFLLGSLWAVFQDTWGNYWSNDSIENILLIFLVLTVWYIHRKLKFVTFFKNFNLLCSVLLLVTLRLNFLYTKHNFFNNKLNLNYLSNFYYLLFYYYIFLFKKNKFLFINFKKKNLFILFFYSFLIKNVINQHFYKFIFIYLFIIYCFYIVLDLIKLVKFKLYHFLIIFIPLVYINYFSNFIKFVNTVQLSNLYYNIMFFYHNKTINLFLFKKNNFTLYALFNNYTSLKYSNYYNKMFNSVNKLVNFF